jgi:hypothetical protein
MSAQIITDAEAVQSLAESLISSHHPELATASFRYIFKEKAGTKGGKPVSGNVKKVSDVDKYLIEGNPDFILIVPMDLWNEMDSSKRTALVDHLLERCTGTEDDKTGEMKWSTREPDVHEFATILQRHGAWNDALDSFASVCVELDNEAPLNERVHSRQTE